MFKYKFFQIPANGCEILESELNGFLSRHAVLDVRQEFFSQGNAPCWCFSIRWRDGGGNTGEQRPRPRVDYKEVLDPEDFDLYLKCRELRKELAGKEEVPAYSIFTNDQLAEIARQKPTNPTALQKISGVGKRRVERYGASVLELLAGYAASESIPD